MRILMVSILSLLLAFSNQALSFADDMQKVDIKEWHVPYEDSYPRDPHVAPDGTVWFSGQTDEYIAQLNPETGKFKRVDLRRGDGIHNVIVGRDGIVWMAGNRNGYIGKYNPQTDTIHRIPMPSEDAYDPHTLIFNHDETRIFFSLQGSNMVGRLDIATEKVNLVSTSGGSRPYGINMAPDGTVWVALFGTYKLGKVNPETMALTEIDLPRRNARPRRLEISSNGNVHYVDYRGGMLGTYDPVAKTFVEVDLPSKTGARPYGMEIDSQDRIWFVETGPRPNKFVGYDTKTKKYFSITPIPSGAGSVRHMMYHKATGTVWFGTDANTIGRAVVE